MKQRWVCPRCGYEYVSPMKVRAVTCHAGHPNQPMNPKDVDADEKASAT